jgi:hypothetical protein
VARQHSVFPATASRAVGFWLHLGARTGKPSTIAGPSQLSNRADQSYLTPKQHHTSTRTGDSSAYVHRPELEFLRAVAGV